jgi:hypothetical protein
LKSLVNWTRIWPYDPELKWILLHGYNFASNTYGIEDRYWECVRAVANTACLRNVSISVRSVVWGKCEEIDHGLRHNRYDTESTNTIRQVSYFSVICIMTHQVIWDVKCADGQIGSH